MAAEKKPWRDHVKMSPPYMLIFLLEQKKKDVLVKEPLTQFSMESPSGGRGVHISNCCIAGFINALYLVGLLRQIFFEFSMIVVICPGPGSLSFTKNRYVNKYIHGFLKKV